MFLQYKNQYYTTYQALQVFCPGKKRLSIAITNITRQCLIRFFNFVFPFFSQVILNAKIFLGLRRVQRNLKRHKKLSESRQSRPAAFLGSKCRISKGEGKKQFYFSVKQVSGSQLEIATRHGYFFQYPPFSGIASCVGTVYLILLCNEETYCTSALSPIRKA